MKLIDEMSIQIERKVYVVDGVPGRYLIDSDGWRFYEVSYCPFPFHTTNRRVQIAHTDLREKAFSAIEAHARSLREGSQP